MKDIDFDELDRAVSSLMGANTPKPASPPDTASSSVRVRTTPTKPQTAAPAPRVPESKPQPTAREGVTAVPVRVGPKPAPAQQRSGQFMDMVPSLQRLAKPVSREGVSVQPRDKDESRSPLASMKPSPQPAAEAPKPFAPELATPAPVKVSRSPQQPEQPGESPFLSGTKVQKRPLNPGSADKRPAASDVIPAQPPEEFSADVTAVESDKGSSQTSTSSPLTVDRPLGDPKNESNGAPSIAQQYREQPNSGDKSHAAIYDSSQFPEPLKHQAKKKSGWLWVLWLVLLLGIGAGGAVALYLSGLI